MKNIYLKPTNKPSNLYKTDKLYKYAKGVVREPLNCINQHLYITDDKDIKLGDLFGDDKIHIFACNDEFGESWRKVILSTDPDLISDGIQAIDDEFLGWFVNNSDCEFVEVEKGFADGTAYGHNFLDYKIIFPKEESEQSVKQMEDRIKGINVDTGYRFKEEPNLIKCYCGHTITCDCSPLEPTQETELEEAAREYYKRGQLGFEKPADTERAFLRGAKWQAERMYSEEDLHSAFEAGMMFIGEDKGSFGEWFEQFKKKYR